VGRKIPALSVMGRFLQFLLPPLIGEAQRGGRFVENAICSQPMITDATAG
jgi:hypothetical protein